MKKNYLNQIKEENQKMMIKILCREHQFDRREIKTLSYDELCTIYDYMEDEIY